MPDRVLFISHVHEDADLAAALKDLVEDAFAGAVGVFVSSDRRSLSPGDDWLQAIGANLREANDFLILLTPVAVTRPWVHFEAGAAFGRDKRFMPVCTRGLRIDDVQPPLNSRQLLAVDRLADVEAIVTALATPYGYLPKPDRKKLELVEKLAMYTSETAEPAGRSPAMQLAPQFAQPILFHMWTADPARIVGDAVQFEIGFILESNGPGVVRDLYVNFMMTMPGAQSTLAVQPDMTNWVGQQVFGMMFNLISKESFRLAPLSPARPLALNVSLAPPFQRDLTYTFTFGHATSPVRRLRIAVARERLQEAYAQFLRDPAAEGAGHAFVRAAMGIRESKESGDDIYESP